MFDSKEHFECFNKVKHSGNHIHTHYYRFKVKRDNIYIVQIEKFKNEFYVLKFFSKAHRQSDKKFNLLTNQYHASRILGVVMRLAYSIYEKNKQASFGFIGEPIIVKDSKEDIHNTKRFRLYKKLSIIFFRGKNKFKHYENTETSAYLLVNMQNEDTKKYTQEMIKTLIELYPQLTCNDISEVID